MTVDGSWVSDVFGTGPERPLAVAAFIVRWVGYVGVLIAAGAAAFLVWVADTRDHDPLARGARRAAAIGIVAALVTIPLYAALASGEGLVAMARPDVLLEAAATSVGVQSLLQVIALGALWLVLKRRNAALFAPLALTAGAVALGALVVAGHTRTTEPTWLLLIADALHVVAAAVWIGGLVLLWPALRRRRADEDPVGAAGTVARFSRMVTYALLGVVGAGLVLGWRLVGSLQALVTTEYGRVLVVKLLVATSVIALGAYNDRRLVPLVAQAAGGAGPPYASDHVPVVAAPTTPWRGWQTLARTVHWEVLGLVAVLGVTAVLVEVPPAAMTPAAPQPYGATVPASDGNQLILMVEPNRVGSNRIHLYLVDSAGEPADAGQLQLRLSPPSGGPPLERTLAPIFPGHWLHAGGEFTVPGAWRIDVATSDVGGDRMTATVTVEVAP